MKPRVECARAGCGKPQLHEVHVGSGWQHDFVKPERKKRREQMAAHSPKQQDYYDNVRIPEVQEAQGKPCEAGLPGCTGYSVDIHEIVSRKEAGSLQKAVAFGTLRLCRSCHNTITNNPEMARERGFSKRLRDIGRGEVA